jgi:hypothetical protein
MFVENLYRMRYVLVNHKLFTALKFFVFQYLLFSSIFLCIWSFKHTQSDLQQPSINKLPRIKRLPQTKFSSKSVEFPTNMSDYTNPLSLYQALRGCNDHYISTHINRALDTLSDALRLYGPQRVFSSYNGGKDADVIMHLLRASYAKFSNDHGCDYQPELVYFMNDDEFEEVTQHIQHCQELFTLKIISYPTGIVQVK